MILGIDPDLHNVGVAFLSLDGTGAAVTVLKNPGVLGLAKSPPEDFYLTPPHLIVVEGQTIYPGKTKNPKDIMHLSCAAGVLVGLLSASFESPIIMPEPREWKGSGPKQIHQGRILSRLGVEYDRAGTRQSGYCYPTHWPDHAPQGAGTLNKGDWKHVVDAIGLAQYGLKEYKSRSHSRTDS